MSRDPSRSKNMRKIHSKDASVNQLSSGNKGYRYHKNYKALQYRCCLLTKYKIRIFFCDSRFFMGKDWEILKLRLEKVKSDYWIKKIEHNRSRDFETDKNFYFSAIQSIHFWGQDIKSILLSVSRPLKRSYMGYPLFKLTLLNLQTDNKKFVAVFIFNTATNFLYIYYICKHISSA